MVEPEQMRTVRRASYACVCWRVQVTLLLVGNNALQGILSSFFFKYADTILKKYSSTVATIFTGAPASPLQQAKIYITWRVVEGLPVASGCGGGMPSQARHLLKVVVTACAVHLLHLPDLVLFLKCRPHSVGMPVR